MADPVTLLALAMALAATGLVVWAGRRPAVAPVLTVTWAIHCILWSALPLLIQQFLKEPVENSPGPLSRNELAVLHSSLLLLLITIHLAIKRPLVEPITRFFDQRAPDVEKLFWPTVAVLGILVGVEFWVSQVDGSSFAEVVAFSVTADSGQLAQSGLLTIALGFLVGHALALIATGRPGGVGSNTLSVAWCVLIVFSGFSISRGTRSIVLLPVAAGAIALTTLRGKTRRKAATLLGVGGLLTIVIGAPVAGIMGLARGGSGTISMELVQEAFSVVFGASSVGERVQVIAQEANRKFDAIGPGIELLAMEPPGSAGFSPFLSASASPIPRLLYPSKPVPTSRDGTYLGTPYRIAAKAYGDPEVGMVVPVSASAIALWEFSWLGPLILVLTNVINLCLLNSVLLSRNVIARAVGISMLGLPNSEFFIGPPSTLLQNDLRLLLFFGVLAVLLLLWDMVARPRVGATAPSRA